MHGGGCAASAFSLCGLFHGYLRKLFHGYLRKLFSGPLRKLFLALYESCSWPSAEAAPNLPLDSSLTP